MRPLLFDKIVKSLGDEPVEFTTTEEQSKQRIMRIVEIMLKNPLFTDMQIYERLSAKIECSFVQVARDITLAQRIISFQYADDGDNPKAYWRYWTTQQILKTIQAAVQEKSTFAMNNLIKTMVQCHLLDKEDIPVVPWNEILPPPLLFTNNPSVLQNYTPLNENEITSLKKKYGANKQIELTEAIIVEDNERTANEDNISK